MKLQNLEVQELSLQETIEIDGGLTVNQERVIAFAFFGLFGLAVYELSRAQDA